MAHYKHFKHLHVPDTWEQYWTRYPNGYTMLEALINWVGQVNDMVDTVNHNNEHVITLDRNFRALDKELRAVWKAYKEKTDLDNSNFRDEVYTIINNFIASIDPRIQDIVVDSLTGWLDDGTLADIINNDVFKMKANTADHSLSPDYFTGTDQEKLTQAIDDVLAKGGGIIRLPRMYDLTGQDPIMLDKTDAKDRRVVTFLGDGGGITKNDAGFIFDSNINNSGDWFFNNVRFESTAGAGTTVFNGGKIIRIHFTDCHLRDVDHYGTAENRFFQTVSINGGSAVGGSGWLFDGPCYYDVKIAGGFFAEHREHFLRQTLETTGEWKSINGLRVIGSMMEGLSGKTFEFARVEQLTISGNYFESNKQGYIDFRQADYLDAIDISDNRVFHHPDTNTNNLTSFIQWGGRLRGVSTRNNFSRYLAMHDTTEAVTSVNYTVFSSQDVALDNARNDIPNIDPDNQVFKIIKPYQLVNNDNNGSFYSRYTATSDINTMTATGTYHVGPSAPNSANPSGWGFVEVSNLGSFVMQKYYSRGGATGLSYIRFRESNVWTDWKIMSDPR